MRLTTLLAVAALMAAAAIAHSDVPPFVSYQGVLRDASGSPVSDGTYSVQFSIFDAETAGANLWTETQSVTTSGGVFDVYLGTLTPLDTLAWDVPYWLGIRIEGEPWLVPRTPFTTVPYAAHAGYADTVLEGDTDWSIDGDDVYHETGKVGIGLASGAGAPLDVLAGSTNAGRFRNDAQGANFAIYARNEHGTAGGFYGGSGNDYYPSPHAALYARGEADHLALSAISDNRMAIYAHSNSSAALQASTDTGSVCASFTGGKVIINDRIQVDEFFMGPGTGGYVLTSDSYGLGTWQPPAAVSDGDWTISASNIYRETGNVGIGTSMPEVRLDIAEASAPCARFRNDASGADFTVEARNEDGTAGAFFAGPSGVSHPVVPVALFANAAAGHRGAHLYSEDDYALLAISGSDRAVYATTSGDYCAYLAGGEVEVEERLKLGEFQMEPGTAGHVLTSDASGVGTWQAPAASADSDWTVAGSDMYSGVTGHVGVGADAPTAKLQVYTGANEQALRVYHDIATSGQTASIERGEAPGVNNDILQLEVPAGSGAGFQFIECEQGDDVEFSVDGDGYIYCGSGAEFYDLVVAYGGLGAYGSLDVWSDTTPALDVTSSEVSYGAKVVSAEVNGTGTYDVYAVWGESEPSAGYGVGVAGIGGFAGVYGQANPAGSSGYHYGLNGFVSGGTGTNHGVCGTAINGATNYGVYGEGSGGTTNYAGWFEGDVNVTGTLYGGTPARRIDHPLDPENKYLVHSGVQSDEMVNVYSGNVTLDAGGEARVEVPGWLEAVNSDFRYQLTCIGGHAPVFIAEEVSSGSFRIAGGEPGLKVSWQVTGVRSDPVALASPLEVESAKPSTEAGTYVNPEVYGRPATDGTTYREDRALDVQSASSPRPEPIVRERQGGD